MVNHRKVYCYETKILYTSMKKAADSVGLTNSSHIFNCLNIENRTAGGCHWCTDLSIFDNKILLNGSGQNLTRRKIIYCYETKEKFNSLKEAALKYKITASNLVNCIDNPFKTLKKLSLVLRSINI